MTMQTQRENISTQKMEKEDVVTTFKGIFKDERRQWKKTYKYSNQTKGNC